MTHKEIATFLKEQEKDGFIEWKYAGDMTHREFAFGREIIDIAKSMEYIKVCYDENGTWELTADGYRLLDEYVKPK